MLEYVLMVGMLLTDGSYLTKTGQTFSTIEACQVDQEELVRTNQKLVLDDGRLVVVCVPK